MHTVLYPVNELKIGGAEQQLLELVRGLDKSRFKPIIAPLYSGGALDSEFRAVPGAEVIDLHRTGKYDASPLWKLTRMLLTRRVDVIQPFLTPATFFGLLPALLVGTPVKIVTERCGVRQNRHAGYKLYRTVEDRLTHFADAVAANSIAGQDLLIKRGIPSAKVRVIYNGINPDRLRVDWARVRALREQLAVPHDGDVIAILASLTPAKGHNTFLRAAAQLADRRPSARFAVIGDGPLRAELEALATSLGVAKKVTFFGYQRGVADFLAACDVLVSASCDNEGCSNSILEAMAIGVPVVATDVGGNGELVKDRVTGYLVPASDDVALAARVEHAIGDADGRRRMIQQAQQMIDEIFSLRRMVADYEALYEELITARRYRLARPEPVSH